MSVPGNQNYEKKVLETEKTRLTYFTEITQNAQAQEEQGKLFFNLSLKNILENTSMVFVSIINEIVSGQIHTLSDLVYIFFRDNRMIYLGLVIIFIAFSMYIVDIAS